MTFWNTRKKSALGLSVYLNIKIWRAGGRVPWAAWSYRENGSQADDDMPESPMSEGMKIALTAFATLVCVYVGYRLQRSHARREKLSDARYRLLVLLRQLQVEIATAVDRTKVECAKKGDGNYPYHDKVLKLALGETTRQLQDAILDVLRRHDNLPELRDVRRALWCPGAGAEKWLLSLRKAVEFVEKRVCPKLRTLEDELYADRPEKVRRIIEHPEELWGPTGHSGENPRKKLAKRG